MNEKKFTDGKINGIVINKIAKYEDARGTSGELFRTDCLPADLRPEMCYFSISKPQIPRGPHEHLVQTDIFAFFGPGSFKVYLWDNRDSSSSFNKRMIFLAGEDNPLTLIVPPGVVHGYKNISKHNNGLILNFPDKLYKGINKAGEADEIRHEDSENIFYKDFISG